METAPIHNNQQPKQNNSSRQTWKAAREFEAVFTSLMMKSMRKTVFDDGLIEKSLGEKIYTDMLDLEYAKIVSNNASFGLAEQIVKQISQMNYQPGMLAALQNIGNQPWMIDHRMVPGNQTTYDTASLKKRVAHWNEYIDEASSRYTIDRSLISAVIAQESAGNPYAVSHAGAKGLMQIIDSTAQELGVKHIFNPRENIMAGTRYLDRLLKEFDGNETLALASYNAGPAAVKKYNDVPPYKETQNYVARVLSLRDEFTQLEKAQQMPQKEKGE